MTALHEKAVEQFMRTGHVALRDEENGNLYVSNQWDGTYKIITWYDHTVDSDEAYEALTNRDGALKEIHTWCANLEKLLSL